MALLHVSFNRIRLKDKTCSRSKCYSDLGASDKTHGAVECGCPWVRLKNDNVAGSNAFRVSRE
ncbi:hypothetical protein GOC91_19275 [Sinorhizobium medicae]|uniref:Uncharacterized protein n=1 Tax=Sinorhizobium medicae TaxID=110321 RepID=A0A6G1WV24_9HYPH|nr:hypothetical protein [Sinorhizobium medicae]MDX0412124.1 hypothetical protein [Sinorhizobium medicae]MDX0418073.1 hypothetical protein [Sinorhizobium medicae]MDX0431209.1 hypothetical protein [Sinorhizobium medicae]MDX0438380.1 hypothetical protein [Sinorhizobium medicae]